MPTISMFYGIIISLFFEISEKHCGKRGQGTVFCFRRARFRRGFAGFVCSVSPCGGDERLAYCIANATHWSADENCHDSILAGRSGTAPFR